MMCWPTPVHVSIMHSTLFMAGLLHILVLRPYKQCYTHMHSLQHLIQSHWEQPESSSMSYSLEFRSWGIDSQIHQWVLWQCCELPLLLPYSLNSVKRSSDNVWNTKIAKAEHTRCKVKLIRPASQSCKHHAVYANPVPRISFCIVIVSNCELGKNGCYMPQSSLPCHWEVLLQHS